MQDILKSARLSLIVTVLLGLAVAGCAQYTVTLPPGVVRVGIANVIGDRVSYQDQQVVLRDWGLRQRAAEQIRDSLGNKYVVEIVNVDEAPFARTPDLMSVAIVEAFEDDNYRAEIGDRLRQALPASTPQKDVWLLLAVDCTQIPHNICTVGFAINHPYQSLRGTGYDQLWLGAALYVIDGRTFKPLSIIPLSEQGKRLNLPDATLGYIGVEKWEDVTPAERTQIRSYMAALLASRINFAFSGFTSR